MRMLSRFAMIIGLSAAGACAGTMPKTPQSLVARFDQNGVSRLDRAVPSGGVLVFKNDDVRPHEVYSNDCPELGSQLLPPGRTFAAQVAEGPKTCHFQDLLAPAAPELSGTVRVAEPPESAFNPGS